MNMIKLTALAAIAVAAGFTVSAPAYAGEHTVDTHCWELANGEIDCANIEDLKAECKLTDPNNRSEVCQDVSASSKRPQITGKVISGKRKIRTLSPTRVRTRMTRRTTRSGRR